MKQFYLIGIGLGVGVLIVFGLHRAFNSMPEPDTRPEAYATEENATTPTNLPTPQNPMEPTTSTETQTDEVVSEKPLTNVILKTSMGDITVELFTGDMPVTAGNFLKLARSNFYDGVKFHRVIDGFMIQGGDPLTKDDSMAARWGTGGPGYAIKDEFGPANRNERGTLSMANSGPNSGGSQFFINTVDNAFLDKKHPVFGRVTSGMDVIDRISQSPTKPGDVPVTPIVIQDITVVQ